MKWTFLLLIALTSCAKETLQTPAGYDLNHPKVYDLPAELSEISGIAFHDGNRDTLFAEHDEAGIVYGVKLGTGIIQKSEFKNSGDFEDIAISNGIVSVLKSNGKLYTFPFSELKNRENSNAKEWTGMVPRGEYEGLASFGDDLYILCKDCEDDKNLDQVGVYRFQLQSDGIPHIMGKFMIDVSEIRALLPMEGKRFKPSGLAFNKVLNEWYILSGVNKLLVVADPKWQVKKVYSLDPKLYIQAEGIAFDRDNTLFISSEGSETSPAKVFEIKFIKKAILPK